MINVYMLWGCWRVGVAGLFGVARITINRLWQRYRANASDPDRPRTGRPRVTTLREDRRLRSV